jgi:hypothetical protein
VSLLFLHIFFYIQPRSQLDILVPTGILLVSVYQAGVSSNGVDAWIGRLDLGHQLLIPALGVDYW